MPGGFLKFNLSSSDLQALNLHKWMILSVCKAAMQCEDMSLRLAAAIFICY